MLSEEPTSSPQQLAWDQTQRRLAVLQEAMRAPDLTPDKLKVLQNLSRSTKAEQALREKAMLAQTLVPPQSQSSLPST